MTTDPIGSSCADGDRVSFHPVDPKLYLMGGTIENKAKLISSYFANGRLLLLIDQEEPASMKLLAECKHFLRMLEGPWTRISDDDLFERNNSNYSQLHLKHLSQLEHTWKAWLLWVVGHHEAQPWFCTVKPEKRVHERRRKLHK